MATEQATESIDSSGLKGRLSGWWQRIGRSGASTGSTDEGELPTRWWELAGYGGLLVVAAVTRLWDLGSRAIHHDESLHALFSWNLANGDGYRHSPMMHGPFQFEANAAIFFIFGDSDYTARLLYALLGIALVGLPFFFRRRLGRLGALLVAALLTFSPAMLYFSRFARNDILMAVWTLGLVTSMWRYFDSGKNRYLYLTSALLALAFATKETTYIVTLVLGMFLALFIAPNIWAQVRSRINIGEVSPPVALMRLVSGLWSTYRSGVSPSGVSRQFSFLVLLVTLTLPVWSALVSFLQDTDLLGWANVVLAAETGDHIGAPSGGGLVIATVVVVSLLGLSVYWGHKWNWSVWWRCALIFYTVWVLLYTTFFTNIDGIGSGVWQSMGYWIVQQDVARGNQPWYYYFVLTSVYEFLPLIFGVIAAVYYLRKNDVFGLFLVFWAVATFILYTAASEKMPWLLVNVALPLIVLTGKFLADVVQGVQWRRLTPGGGVLVLAGVPLFLFLLWRLAFYDVNGEDGGNILFPLLVAVALLGLVAVGAYLARRVGIRNFVAFSVVPVAIVLLVLTVRAGWTASYKNGDIPVEMIVYTQTSPDITQLIKGLREAGETTGEQNDVPISIDQTSGFTWPWAWYLRDYTRVDYPAYDSGGPGLTPASSVLLVHSRNRTAVEEALKDGFTAGERVRHRWWFPEETYRDLTLGEFLKGFVDRQTWRNAMDYFLYRDNVRPLLGSEDSYVYFSNGFPQSFSAPQ